jgi:hypothetical protein
MKNHLRVTGSAVNNAAKSPHSYDKINMAGGSSVYLQHDANRNPYGALSKCTFKLLSLLSHTITVIAARN